MELDGKNCSVECEFLSSAKGVLTLIEMVSRLFDADCLRTLRIKDIKKSLMKNVGLGRLGYLKNPMKISDLINKIKSYLSMTTFRVALGHGKSLGNQTIFIKIF